MSRWERRTIISLDRLSIHTIASSLLEVHQVVSAVSLYTTSCTVLVDPLPSGEGALLALKGSPMGWGSDIGKESECPSP